MSDRRWRWWSWILVAPLVMPTAATGQARFIQPDPFPSAEWESRPLPSTREGIEARLAEVQALLAELRPQYEAEQADRDARILATVEASYDSTRAGPFLLIASKADLPQVTAAMREAWKPFERVLGNDTDWFERYRFVFTREQVRTEVWDRPDVVRYNLPPSGRAIDVEVVAEDLGQRFRGLVNRPLGGTSGFTSWLGGGGVAEAPDQLAIWTALASTPSPAGPACIQGDGASCMVVLGLDPEGGAADAITRLQRYLALPDRRTTVDFILDQGDRRTQIDAGYAEYLYACADDPSTVIRPGMRTEWNCARDLSGPDIGWLVWNQDAGRDARLNVVKRSLLNHALEIGPPAALSRMADRESGNRDYESLYEEIAGMPLADLVESWHEATLGGASPPHGGPASTETPLAYFWAGVLVLFSFMSTRRRFG